MERESKSIAAIKAWKTRKQAGVKRKARIPKRSAPAPAKDTEAQPREIPEENPSAICHFNGAEAHRQANPDEFSEKPSQRQSRFSEFKAFPEVQTWLKTVSTGTCHAYLTALKKFCDFSGKDPHQLILQRDSEVRSNEPNSRTGIRDLVLDFRTYLEKEGFAPKIINSFDGAVRSFFTAILGKAGMVNVKNYRNREVSTKKELVPTLEEFKVLLDVSNLRKSSVYYSALRPV